MHTLSNYNDTGILIVTPEADLSADRQALNANFKTLQNKDTFLQLLVGAGIVSKGSNDKLQVLDGAAGAMRFPYEVASFERQGDNKVGVYTSSTSGADGASLVVGQTRLQLSDGFYPAFEWQYIYDLDPAQNSLRCNFLERNAAGTFVGGLSNIVTVMSGGQFLMQATILADGSGSPPAMVLTPINYGFFQVGGCALEGADPALCFNKYFNGSQDTYIGDGTAFQITQVLSSDGELHFAAAASGSGGGAITFTDLMVLTSDGNVILPNLPASPSGLPSGALYKDGSGFLKVA